jgi:hypothetical protein
MSTLRTAAQGAARYENNLARRSQRQITAPARFRNNQARNAEVAAPRATTKSSKRKRATEPKTLPKAAAQAKVFAILDELSVGKNEKAYNMLYSIYRDASSTFFTRVSVKLNEEELRKSIEKQYTVLMKNIRQGGETNANKLTINLSNIDNKINFCLLMWLDMSHDGTLGADGMNFESFLQSSVLRTFLGENPKLENNTELMNRMLNIGVIQVGKVKGIGVKKIKFSGLWPGYQFENKVKTNLPELFDVKAPLVKTAEVVKLATLAVNREKKPIYVSIDSESEKKTISKLIDNAKYSFNSRNRGTISRYFLKPIITLANRVDPGRLMPSKGVSEEFAKLMQEENKLKSTQLYNVKDCVFQVGNTRLTLTSGTEGTFNLRFGRGNRNINNINIPHGVTAGTAKKSVNDTEKLSKFLGDFMQILVAASNNGAGPVGHTMVIGTLDGIMSGMTCFIFKNILGQEPKLFIDMSYKQANQVYMFGVEKLIQTGNGINKQRKQVVAESNIGSNIAPSPLNRPSRNRLTPVAEGSGNTINKRNTRKSPNVNEGTGESNGNRGNNRNRALAGMLGRVAPKPTPIQIRNSNSNSNNNMNNANRALAGMLGRMGPSQGQKRKRENNNNNNKNKNKNAQSGVGSRNSMAGNKKNNLKNNATGGKKPKINVNVAQRNRLIQNLKKKNLSNAAINNYVKSYNNGTKSVNQIIQEVRANAKRKQNAKNAATLRTLRQLRPELFN